MKVRTNTNRSEVASIAVLLILPNRVLEWVKVRRGDIISTKGWEAQQ